MATGSQFPSTFGTIARRHLEGDLEFSVVTLRSNLSIPPHRHQRAQIIVVLEGSYAEFAESAQGFGRWLGPGSVVLRAPGVLHSNYVGPCEARTLLVDFGSRWFASLQRALSIRLAIYSFDFVLGEIGREVAAELVGGDEPPSKAIKRYAGLLAARSSDLLAEPLSKAPPAWFLQALAIARAESARNLSVARLALRLGVHPATLTGAFREHRRTTTKAFLMALRLRRAARGLAESEAGIDQIALDCGFCDQAHLGRHFKRRYGVTPAAYRRCRRGG